MNLLPRVSCALEKNKHLILKKRWKTLSYKEANVWFAGDSAPLIIIFAEGRYCHITPLLIKLHWLPIQSRIVFKILLLTFKILHGTAPTYLDSLISLKPQSCYNLRSSCDTLLLKQPSFKSKVTLGDRSFTCAAPKLWNALPFEVRDSKSLDVFKSKLKTHNFRLAFLL